MKQEALEQLPGIRDELEAAVESVLSDERDGLNVLELRKRIYKHSEYDAEPDIRYIHVWLAELGKDYVVVHDWDDLVYLLPRYADKEPEAYRPTIHRHRINRSAE